MASDPNDRDLQTPLLHPPPPPLPLEKLCIDDMLQRYCGEFGFWQLRHFVLASLAWALEAFHTMVMIFADREPRWRCLDGGGGGPGSGCFPEAASVCELPPGSWEWVGGAGSSTVAEFGLICGQKFKVGLVQALFFGGCMIGESIIPSTRFYRSLINYPIIIFKSTQLSIPITQAIFPLLELQMLRSTKFQSRLFFLVLNVQNHAPLTQKYILFVSRFYDVGSLHAERV